MPPSFHPPMPLGKALRQAQHFVLLGEPGAGKSTALQFIGLCFAKADEAWAADRLGINETRYPVLIQLQAEASALAAGGDAVMQALTRQVQAKLQTKMTTARALVQTWADQDRLLALLDGLDEVSDGQRSAVRKQIEDFAGSPVGKRARLIVTSRLAGFSALDGLAEFVLKPFDDPQKEVLPYLAAWLGALKEEWAAQSREKAAELLQKMQAQPALRRVLDNPLLLRLAAETYAATGEIARNRADLYRRHVDELWRRAEERGAPAAEKEHSLQALDVLAWHLQQGGGSRHSALVAALQKNNLAATNADAEALLRCLREKMGILACLPAEKEAVYIFAHQTLREYFVAEHLSRAWRANPRRTFAFLQPRLHLATWREPLALLIGGLKDSEAAHLVRRVWQQSQGLAGLRRPYERYLKRDLFLAASLAAEAGAWDGAQGFLLPALRSALTDADPSVRSAAAGALGTIGDASAVPTLLATLKDKNEVSLDVRVAAAEALGRILIGRDVAVAPRDRAQLLAQMRQTIRISARMHETRLLSIALQQEAAVLVAASPWQDPLLPPPVPRRQVWGRRMIMGILALLLPGTVALAAAVLSGAQDVIKEFVKSLLQAEPLGAVALAVVTLAALAALAGWGWEYLGGKK